MCLLAACCHMLAHQVASHKLIGYAELYLQIRQTQNHEMLTVVLEV